MTEARGTSAMGPAAPATLAGTTNTKRASGP